MPRTACCTPSIQNNKDAIYADLEKHYRRGLEATKKGDEEEEHKEKDKHYLEALKHYERAIDKCDRAKFKHLPVYYNNGNVHRKRKDYHMALGAYHRALEECPTHSEVHLVHFAMGLTCKSMADCLGIEEKVLKERLELYKQATVHYSTAISANSEYKEAYNNLGIVQVEIDQVLYLMERLENMVADENHNVTYLKQAISSYDKALAKDPSYASAKWNKAVATEKLSKYEDLDDQTKQETMKILGEGRHNTKKVRLCGAGCIIS